MTIVLSKIVKVPRATRYSTGIDTLTGKYRIIGPDGTLEPKFVSRPLAEKFALSIAKMVFAKQDQEYMMNRARAILPSDVLHEIGEARLFDGPLYEREEEYVEAD